MKIIVLLGLLLSPMAVKANEELIPDAFCDTTTSFPRTYQSNRCPYYDEVLVGIDKVEPMTIRCARLRTNCYRKVEPGDATTR